MESTVLLGYEVVRFTEVNTYLYKNLYIRTYSYRHRLGTFNVVYTNN